MQHRWLQTVTVVIGIGAAPLVPTRRGEVGGEARRVVKYSVSAHLCLIGRLNNDKLPPDSTTCGHR